MQTIPWPAGEATERKPSPFSVRSCREKSAPSMLLPSMAVNVPPLDSAFSVPSASVRKTLSASATYSAAEVSL